MSVNWSSPTWGMAGTNVHGYEQVVARKPFPSGHPMVREDSTGSWLHDNDNRRDEE